MIHDEFDVPSETVEEIMSITFDLVKCAIPHCRVRLPRLEMCGLMVEGEPQILDVCPECFLVASDG